MKPHYMLDTNICIYIAKNQPARVRSHFEGLRAGQLVMSVITYGELAFGASKSSQRNRALSQLKVLLQDVPIAALDASTGDVYGEIRARLEEQGRVIGENDTWIAAHALALDLTLVTNNEREFNRIPGLVVENWAK